jgi:hypothetical protein
MEEQRALFRSDTFDLIAGEFATNLSYYRNYTGDDTIACMFLGCALDIIDCTYYTFAKSLPEEKRKIVGSFVSGWNDDVFGTQLFNDIFDVSQTQEVISQHRLLLEALRDRYNWMIRGFRPRCWSESSMSIAKGMDECRSRLLCLAEEKDKPPISRSCGEYYKAWRGTMLTMEESEELRGDAGRLADAIRDRCRVLNLLTTRQGLTEYLEKSYGQGETMRTVRGAIPRLLTLLVDESLADLSRKMALPAEDALYFANPPP